MNVKYYVRCLAMFLFNALEKVVKLAKHVTALPAHRWRICQNVTLLMKCNCERWIICYISKKYISI